MAVIPKPLSVAVVQLTSTADVAHNMGRALALLQQAAAAGARLIALPENYGFLGADRAKLAHAQDVEDGPMTVPLREFARRADCYVLAGSIPERALEAAKTYNTSVLIGPDGETVAAYRKIHLFDVALADGARFAESASVAAGTAPVVAAVDDWPVGLSICYDLRFPELYRALVSAGARLLLVPAAFTLHTGKDHWEILLRARAIENLCYVAAPAQFGAHGGGRQSWGKSQVIDPWGCALACAPEREGFVMALCDAAAQREIRQQIPALEHRRLS